MTGTKTNDLRLLICGKYVNLSALADKLGWTRQKMSDTVNNKRTPTLGDVSDLADALGMSLQDMSAYFLN